MALNRFAEEFCRVESDTWESQQIYYYLIVERQQPF